MSDRRYNVLVLDDEKFILLTVAACLKTGPYQVTTADRAEDALNAFKQKRFDAILSDIMSPVLINSQNVTIAGGVNRPGRYSVSDGMRLSDLFAMAGGSASRLFDGQVVDVADFKNSIFVRSNKYISLDFSAAIERGDHWSNIKLHRDDYIYIAVRSETMHAGNGNCWVESCATRCAGTVFSPAGCAPGAFCSPGS